LNKYEIVRKIEEFAPLETQEKWDCSGWGVNTDGKLKIENGKSEKNEDVGRVQQLSLNTTKEIKKDQVHKILFALTVTDKVVQQAREKGCDMIISHHPLFYVPLAWKDINIYCAHTNLDKAEGGTTDTLIKKLGFTISERYEYVRIVRLESEITTEELKQKLLKISPKLRYVNNYNSEKIKTIGFCAGSGSEFINEYNTDAFVTGDLKFHTALDSRCIVFDIGHFESEIFAPEILKEITGVGENGVIADEKSPFI
jgi:dinuclear metal center YbgI/SA1388 family protein